MMKKTLSKPNLPPLKRTKVQSISIPPKRVPQDKALGIWTNLPKALHKVRSKNWVGEALGILQRTRMKRIRLTKTLTGSVKPTIRRIITVWKTLLLRPIILKASPKTRTKFPLNNSEETSYFLVNT